jgi:S1-C subfamily serine protease
VLRSLASFLLIAAMALGCASGQRKPYRDLEKGVCPSYIIYPGGRSELGRERYGETATEVELSSYRDRELANCEQRLADGEVLALNVLLEYWYKQQNLQKVAAAYKTYLESGSDDRQLAEAGSSLYELYSEGQPGLSADPAAAFHYLGLAMKYDPDAYELLYADALYTRGLYVDAFSYYKTLIEREPSEDQLSKSERCEVNLKVADLYFRGRGVKENWYVGYNYWLQGLSMAADPNWGSCDKQTYYDHTRYAYESGRKKAVDRRLQALSSAQKSRVKDAWAAPDKGLSYIAALDFRRPLLREPKVAPSRQSPRQPARVAVPGRYPAARPWTPLGGAICQLQASTQPISWSRVFQLRSGAIWSVKSTAGNAQSMGSAVAVSPTKLVTNCHLIQDSADVTLLKAGRSMRAEVLAADREGDRCILKAAGQLSTYVGSARRHSGLLVGEDVAAIGNPKGLDTSLSRGLVAQKRNKNGHAYVQTDAAISSGSSGGGLFDTSGNLVGITTFKVSTGESLNFAIAIEEFCR